MGSSEKRWEEAKKIFRVKEQFHKDRARLPIEEKIKMLVKLQKLAIDIPTAYPENRFKMVWEI